MYCPKCGSETPDTANFCPKCGANIERFSKKVLPKKEQPERNLSSATKKTAVKGNHTLLKIFLAVIGIVVVFRIIGSNSDNGGKNVSAERIAQLNPEVTENRIPGTYISSNGEIVAIWISDESVLDVKFKALGKALGGKLTSDGYYYSSKIGWVAQRITLDAEDESFTVFDGVDMLSDQNAKIEYNVKGKMMTLELPNGNKEKYTKVSDEYNLDAIFDESSMGIDDIIGIYSSEAGRDATKNTMYESVDPYYYYLQIDKVDNENVRAAILKSFGRIQEDLSNAQLVGLYEKIEYTSFALGRTVYLSNTTEESSDYLIEVAFRGVNMVSATPSIYNLLRMERSNLQIDSLVSAYQVE